MVNNPSIGVVIPTLGRDSLPDTVRTINRQTLRPDEIIVIYGDRGANAARNKGFFMSRCNLVVFSDDDISWEPDAFRSLYGALQLQPKAAYSYGWYSKGDDRFCMKAFDADLLRRKNYISTMSMIRADQFPGFDERIKRLQDWDLWLTMLARGKNGVYCGAKIFDTHENEGITSGGIPWKEATQIIKEKHGL